MKGVRIMSFSISINGEPRGLIYPSRGLRQRNSLSPYLYLLCIEGLVNLLSKAAIANSINGVKIYGGAPRITHFF